jgi:FkbM family methyltransferase
MPKNLTAKVFKLARIMATPAWRDALLINRAAAGVEHRIVLGQLGTISTVVDIGANRGQFALVARCVFPSAHIVSFEPLPGPASVFRSVFASDTCVTLHEAAIGPSVGETTIHISKCDDSSSLLPITAAQSTLFPGTQEASTAVIVVGPLSSYLAPEAIAGPALLKLDVQGFELQALAGCEARLAQFVWVYAECSFIELYEGQAFADEVIAWLRERGFSLRGVYNMVYDSQGRAVQADFLFGRSGTSLQAA